MSSNASHPVPPAFAAASRLDAAAVARLRDEAGHDPDAYWARMAQRLDWMRAPTRIRDVDFSPGNFHIHWYADGELNAGVNCLDRHLAARGDRTALIFEPDDPSQPAQHVTRERVRILRRRWRRLRRRWRPCVRFSRQGLTGDRRILRLRTLRGDRGSRRVGRDAEHSRAGNRAFRLHRIG